MSDRPSLSKVVDLLSYSHSINIHQCEVACRDAFRRDNTERDKKKGGYRCWDDRITLRPHHSLDGRQSSGASGIEAWIY